MESSGDLRVALDFILQAQPDLRWLDSTPILGSISSYFIASPENFRKRLSVSTVFPCTEDTVSCPLLCKSDAEIEIGCVIARR